MLQDDVLVLVRFTSGSRLLREARYKASQTDKSIMREAKSFAKMRGEQFPKNVRMERRAVVVPA